MLIENVYRTTITINLPNGKNCYQVFLNRLPEEYVSVIDGKSITAQTLMRFYALEKRLDNKKNTNLRAEFSTVAFLRQRVVFGLTRGLLKSNVKL